MAAVDTPLDLVRQFLANFERKQRNLVKRKGKLDGYREKLAKGETLNEEQRKAVDGYDGVLQSITVVQEFITHSKELADSVERAVKYEESQLAIAHERHTLSFLHTHVCLMRLLNALDANPVRLAIAKASSENHLKLLDVLRALVTAPIIETWPGTSAAALSDAQTFLQQHPALDAVAEHVNNFVTGRSTPVPLPSDYDGPHKKFTFKDARVLCFRLLATPAVQRSMGLPSRPVSIVSSVQEDNSEETVEHEAEETARACSPTVTPTKPVQVTPNRVDMVPTTPQPGTPEIPAPAVPTIGILDQVIKPLGGTFNFLQASKVGAPDPLLVLQSPVHEEVQHNPPMTNGISDSHPHYDPHLPSQMEPPHAEECYTTVTQSKPAGNYSLPTEPHLETIPSQEEQGLHEEEEVVGMPNVDDVQLSTSVSSKPVSYADLVRRQSYSRPSAPNTVVINEVRKREPHKTGESTATESAEVTHNGFHAPHSGHQSARGSYPRGGGASRGRGDFRGGRGGPNRGGFGGAQRRGVSGNRGGRYETGSGRGGAPYRGMSAGVAQPTY